MGQINSCIVRNKYKNKNEHARMYVSGKMVMAYRYLYEQKFGKLSKDLVLDHLCQNPHCINLNHLEPVSIGENVRRGKSAKINRQIAEEIREIYKEKSLNQYELALTYGIGQDQISRIVTKEAWV